ncbi:endo-polygalacturonase [Ranunculus cassubicifolius]
MVKTIVCVCVILSILISPLMAAASVFNVVDLGAKPDGRTDSTNSFVKAWGGACGSIGSAQVYVPRGAFLIRNVVFKGPCRNTDITFRIDGTIVAPSDYNVIGHLDHWISFQYVTGVSIYGGILDGQGTALWACKHAKKKCPDGTRSLSFSDSKNIVINGLKSLNSQMFHIVIDGCQNVKMQGVSVSAAGNSPNTDGIHVQMSTAVTIMSSSIKTGDDCISIGPGTKNLWIENIACGPGHGISIGSLGKSLVEQGVQNVTVKTVTFTGTQNGLRIKTWGRPSNGFVNGVLVQHITMNNVQNPLVIDQNYCPRNEGCPNKVSGVKISQVTYKDIHGTSATQVAIKFDCSTKNPCVGIRMENVRLTYRNRPARSTCENADGSVDGVVQPAGCLQ